MAKKPPFTLDRTRPIADQIADMRGRVKPDDLLRLFASRLQRDPDAPQYARSNNVAYVDGTLYQLHGRWRPVSEIRKRKHGWDLLVLNVAINNNGRMTAASSLAPYLNASGDKKYVNLLHAPGRLDYTLDDLRASLWDTRPSRSVDDYIALARFKDYQVSALLRPSRPAAPLAPKDRYSVREAAKETMYRYSAEYRAELARAKAKEKLDDRRYRGWDVRYGVIGNQRWRLTNAIERMQETTSADVFASIGYTPSPGELFKRTMDDQGRSQNGRWPVDGSWTLAVPPEPCRSGWHVTDAEHLTRWSDWGEHIWLAELQGKIVPHGDKVVGEQGRLVKYLGFVSAKALRDARDARLAQTPEYRKATDELAEVELQLCMQETGYELSWPRHRTPEAKYMDRLVDPNVPLNK